ncbi:MAG: RNA polymerase sigma factor WhiG [Actinomycetota bacterium]|nr:RNA polymerase sigma factor WhiG [Actinomycetota bacterium]
MDSEAVDQVSLLWDAYKQSHDPQLRDQLIVHYSPLVKYVASRVASGLPGNVDSRDLASYGIFGLIDAIEKYEPMRANKFETYAIARIRGAIIDELRAIDWVPRSVRAKARMVEKAIAKLEAKLLRSPTDEEIAAELNLSAKDLGNILTETRRLGVAALDEIMSDPDRSEAPTLGDTIADKGTGPVMTFENEETKQLLALAMNRLADREKMVLALYYYEGFTLAEIGQVLGVTESRVCQIHTKAVMQLRLRLKDLDQA